MCRFDDQCEKAGEPCPCCDKIKKVEWSYEHYQACESGAARSSQDQPDKLMPTDRWCSFTPLSEIPEDAIYGTKDDDYVATWYGSDGVLQTWHVV